MPKNMQVRFVVLHHAMSEVNLLGETHCIHFAAHAANFTRILAAVRIGIGEINRGVAGPLRMRGIGIGDAVLPVRPIPFDAGQREALRSEEIP